jgi:uncharacterized protein YqjF (DUF2071 family)
MVTLRMTWVDLAFLHWRVPVEVLRSLIPAGLEIDTFDNTAWVGIVPFEMKDVAPSGLPPIPTASDFPELNVRTYVRRGDHAGVWFFSLDAGSWLAVMGARGAANLPYFHARMEITRPAGDDVSYESERTHPGAPKASFRAWYRPTGEVFSSAPGTFEHWCTERLCLFSTSHEGGLQRLDIEHARWPLQPAVTDVVLNTMAAASGIALPTEQPHVLFAKRLEVVAHWPVSVE